MIRRPPRSTHCISSAASDVYKRQVSTQSTWGDNYILSQINLNWLAGKPISSGNENFNNSINNRFKNQFTCRISTSKTHLIDIQALQRGNLKNKNIISYSII
eukprot:TRINITY_DN12320_c0_g1_i2.p3 TRINITY_DN12320_c0_g1~~TRINITY_DN12320_c0_g1_i2.p3  ORF type:complete len:102 (-),score=35.79 TRINITY_DN12320_c0_g1_i2:381-686(-)